MSSRSDINYLRHHQVDKTKWDECIQGSDNGLVYALSVYLDHMCPGWDALVLKDYKAVFPLPRRKKFGIRYIYQPTLVAELGLFGNDITPELLDDFLDAIPSKFRYIDLPLNHRNHSDRSFSYKRKNFVLPLNKNYDDICNGYAKNVKRNILKAERQDCVLDKTLHAKDVALLAKAHIHDSDGLKHFLRLCESFAMQNKAICYGVRAENSIIAAAAFLFYKDRVYYILAGNHEESRTRGASHFLVDNFIRDHALSDLVLDFEGSDVEGVAQFYSGFGAVEEPYTAVRWNRLPFFLRWMKK
jgi:hypothetical protein